MESRQLICAALGEKSGFWEHVHNWRGMVKRGKTMEILVYMTAPLEEEAWRIARLLVEKNLAAGVNVIPGIRSVYRWRGEIREAGECILFAQTREESFASLCAEVRSCHSHITPCVVGLPIRHGNPPFLEWIRNTCLGVEK